jgi:hypothetical protein
VGAGAPAVSPNNWSYDFGTVGYGSSAYAVVTITNNGSNDLLDSLSASQNLDAANSTYSIAASTCDLTTLRFGLPQSITFPIGFFLTTLRAGASCQVVLKFSPIQSGLIQGYLAVGSSPSSGGALGLFSMNVLLSGTGTNAPVPAASVTPLAVPFVNTSVGSASQQLVTVTNQSLINLPNPTFTTSNFPIAEGAFTVIAFTKSTYNFGGSMSPGDVFAYTVQFAPTASGVHTGSVTFSFGGVAPPVTTLLTGTAP